MGFDRGIPRTKDGIRRWYKRALQVPVLDNCFYLRSPNDADRAHCALRWSELFMLDKERLPEAILLKGV